MKIKIEIDSAADEEEVIIRCRELTESVKKMQQILDELTRTPDIAFYKDGAEIFLNIGDIMFFETAGNLINAHTADNVFQVKAKLYELGQSLPSSFVRVSKSTILNTSHIYSIEKNITSSSAVKFNKSHKQVFVSRSYYKLLKQHMEDRRKML